MILKKLLAFWKKPTEKINSLTNNEVILLFIIFFPISFLLNFVQNYFSYTFIQDIPFSWKDILMPTGVSWMSLWMILGYFGLGIIEEFIFRWWLKEKWLGKYLPLLTWVSFFCFVVLHARPWEIDFKFWVYIPLTTLGPLLGGLLLTFIRLHSSLKNSIIFHCLHNLIGIILFIILGLIFLEDISNINISFF